ncbi:MAG: CotH kinase family protein [Flavobacteriales bacterium]|nr:CotH kinase family protein [Flavobacteriales bacterium]
MSKRHTLIAVSIPLAVVAGAQCCDYHLSMQDSYGDGWNGAVLEVRVNGAAVGEFAASGVQSTAVFSACNGDTIELEYTAGDWENENSYQLLGTYGQVLLADGPGPAAGVVYSGTADCSTVPPAGTSPCVALPIDTADCVTADNTGVQGTGMAPGCANYQGGDRWYAMPVPASGHVVVSTSGIGGLDDTGIALWTGPDCFNLVQRTCDDDDGPGYFSMANADELPLGDTLYIQAFGYGGGQGAFELCVTDPGTIQLDSTELPIVLLNTLGNTIPYDGKVPALMEIKYNGPGAITRIIDPSNVYNGHIGIGIRGATSSGYPQKPYGVETRNADGTNNNVPLLGMPEENDWVLLSNYNDRSLVRNALAMHLARAMGQYAPRMHLCEVLLDGNYRGIYLIGEKIKRDNGRVNIAKLDPDENSGDDLTGGYILQQNIWDWDNSFQSQFSPIDHPGFDVHFLYEYPEPEVISPQQKTYVQSAINTMETALYADDFTDPLTGYRAYLDVPSFINYFLVNELSRNNDGFKKSVFFHKDKESNGGKLKAGPVWDFDWAWKNLWGCEQFENMDGSGWAHLVNDCPTDNYSTGWYVRLLQDGSFANELRCTWEQQRQGPLSLPAINAWIDSVGTLVASAQARHFAKWPILGQSGPAPEMLPCATTYAAELDTLKQWITTRIAWLDAHLPGTCSAVAVTGPEAPQAFGCSPNPTQGAVRFRGVLHGPARWELSITDAPGRIVERVDLAPGPVDHWLTLQAPGLHLWTLRADGHVRGAGKLVVE